MSRPFTPWRGAIILAFLSALLATSPSAAQRCAGEPWSELDFMVGEWRLTDAEGEELGSSSIERRIDGCALVERWRAGDAFGETLTFRDLAADEWRMVAVASDGFSFTGRGVSAAGGLRVEGTKVTSEGESVAVVESIEPAADGSVRWRELTPAGELVYEVVYWPPTAVTRAAPPRQAAPTPSPAEPPPTPAPTPPPPAERSTQPREVADSDVRVIEPPPQPEPPPEEPSSVRSLGRERAKSLTQVESPMILQFPVGPVESLPKGYSWRTAETARFECESTRVERVGVERVERRGQVELRVSLEIVADYYLGRIEVGVELLDGEVVILESAPEKVSVGRSLPAVVDEGALIHEVGFSLSKDEFERLFSGDPRPELRITLAPL